MSESPETHSPGPVRVAAAQFYSGSDVEANLALVIDYMREAKAAGAQLLVTPENSNRAREYASREECYQLSETLDGQFVEGLREAARQLGIMLAVGVDLRAPVEPEVHIAQILIDAEGEILHVHHKTVLWDYEYTLFVPGSKELKVVDTVIGRIGMLLCADGIVPEVPRILALKGADILLNSLNSRGPDETRVHEPLRAIENHVWHIAANTVGGPADAYPWTGGSQIVSPDGDILAHAGEVAEGMVIADITPATSRHKGMRSIGDMDAWRRPDLYSELLQPISEAAAASMYGPVPAGTPGRPLRVATLQTSWYHSTEWTLKRAAGQIEYAAARGVQLGVFPELFVLRRGEAEQDPSAAAELSARALDVVMTAAREHTVWVVVSLVEASGGAFYSTVYLVDATGAVHTRYRKAHLNESERGWATPGQDLVVAETELGRIGLMSGDEVWLPEVARILSLRGAEVIAHPCDWDRIEAATLAATERTEENRVHLISCARTDNAGGFGSQIVLADRFMPGQPIALMRYPTAIWSRTGFEEDIVLDLDLTDAHSKVQGHHLDPLATRQPVLYRSLVESFVADASGDDAA